MILSTSGIVASSLSASPPVNTVAPVISGTNAVGNMLTTSNGTWTGSTPLTFTYQWKRDGVNITSATSITYTLVQADAGSNITCEVTATNVLGNSSAVSNSLFCYDSNAYDFITAETSAGVTLSSTQQTAINNLVINLKSANIYTKFKAIYPVICGTTPLVNGSTANKFNLINPLDTDGAFRIVFSGGWTHSSTGMTPNGVNAYGDTKLVTNTHLALNSTHLSYYGVTAGVPASYGIGLGSVYLSGDYRFDAIQTGLGATFYPLISSGTSGGAGLSYTPSVYNGLLIGNRNNASTQDGWAGNVKTSLSRASYAKSIYSLFIGARNNTGTADNYASNECRFASIGDGLTDLECQVLNQIVEGYQYELSRNVNPTQSFYYNKNYNNETNAFLYVTQVSNSTQQNALNNFVTELKTYNLWTKMKAVYPMLGGTATTHKYNLCNVQDTNSAFRLTFFGGWTHDSLGAKPNGTNAYASTYLTTPNSQFSVGSVHHSYYNVTNSSGGSAFPNGKTEIGSGSTNTAMSLSVGSDVNKDCGGSAGGFVGASVNLGSGADVRAYVIVSRTSTTLLKAYRNGSLIASNTTAVSNLPFTGDLNIGSNYFSDGTTQRNQWSDRQSAIITFGSGLNDTEASNLRTAVQNYETALGRQV